MKITLILLGFFALTNLSAQQRNDFTRILQLSLAPGISTNGLHPGGYANYFSFNLTSGYSSSNYLMEIGLVSSLNEHETRGLQIAGLANLTGANAFAGLQVKEVNRKIGEGFEANLSGAQFSGLANIVLNNVFGWQTSGGVNIARGALNGFQLAGISNTVFKYSFAVQFAGLYNVSVESMDGVQVAGLFNITQGGLYGMQLGAFNRSGFIQGINSWDNDDPTAIQIGILNACGQMNGFQIGLINYSGRMQGTQLGLINIFRNGKTPQTRDGTSLGLVNIGSSGYFAAYANEIFYTNIEIATGTIKNKRITGVLWEKQIQNALIYSSANTLPQDKERWGIGYGLKKFYFKRSDIPGMNNFHFFSIGITWMHINHDQKKLTRELSLLSRPEVSVGSKIHPKNKICYFFASASYNIYRSKSGQLMEPLINESGSVEWQRWPGFSGGVLFQ